MAETLALKGQQEAAHEAHAQSSRDLAESQLREQALEDKVRCLGSRLEACSACLCSLDDLHRTSFATLERQNSPVL